MCAFFLVFFGFFCFFANEEKCYSRWVVVGQEKPWQVPEDRRTEHIHGAYQVEDSGRPIQAAMRTWGFEVAPGSAACRGVVCKASTAAGEDRLGSSGRQLMDL